MNKLNKIFLIFIKRISNTILHWTLDKFYINHKTLWLVFFCGRTRIKIEFPNCLKYKSVALFLSCQILKI